MVINYFSLVILVYSNWIIYFISFYYFFNQIVFSIHKHTQTVIHNYSAIWINTIKCILYISFFILYYSLVQFVNLLYFNLLYFIQTVLCQ